MKENSFPFVGKPSQNNLQNSGKQDWKSLLDVTTIAYQVVILLALIFLNILIMLQVGYLLLVRKKIMNIENCWIYISVDLIVM